MMFNIIFVNVDTFIRYSFCVCAEVTATAAATAVVSVLVYRSCKCYERLISILIISFCIC